jgi:hypothetical protein
MSELAGERQLMLAVLADAVRSYVGNRGARDREARALFRETLDWFASPDRTTLFSFASICDALDIEPGSVRRMLAARSPTTRSRSRSGVARRPQSARAPSAAST